MTDSQAARRRAALTAAGLTVALVVVAVLVATRYAPLMSFDVSVVRAWHGAVDGTRWSGFFLGVASASRTVVDAVVLGLLAIVFLLRRRLREAAWIVSVLIVNQAMWVLLKLLIDRPRPHIPHQISGFSFPSGHATGIASVMGVLMIVGWRSAASPRSRTLLGVVCVGTAALVGTDRVFLGAHYPSDVVAGWLLGSVVVLVTSAMFQTVVAGPERSMPGANQPVVLDDASTLAVILNPVRIIDAEAFKAKVGVAVRAVGWDEPLWFETTVDDAGASMARAAVAAGADVVAVAGGDGTVRVVCGEMAGTGIPVGVIPAGTGNLLARNLNIPLTHELALDTVLRGQDRAVDVVKIEGDDLLATRFVVMAGLGLDAAIMDGAPDALKARIGWPAYVVAGARHLRYPAVRVDISMDGADPVRRRARTVVIGNVGSLQAGIPLLPDAEIDDGLLDVVVVAPRRLFGWLPVLVRVMAKRRHTDERLDRFTGRSVIITAAHTTPRQLDGDTVGPGTEIRAEIEAGVLLIRVPR